MDNPQTNEINGWLVREASQLCQTSTHDGRLVRNPRRCGLNKLDTGLALFADSGTLIQQFWTTCMTHRAFLESSWCCIHTKIQLTISIVSDNVSPFRSMQANIAQG